MDNRIIELENKIKELTNELSELKAELENKESNDGRRWKPKVRENYYYIYGCGEVNEDIWTNAEWNTNRYLLGNCFRTEEEAKFEIERLKVIAEMREFEESPDREWDGDTEHYFIYCNAFSQEINIDFTYKRKSNGIFFESKARAKACIDKVGALRIKRFYARVKED